MEPCLEGAVRLLNDLPHLALTPKRQRSGGALTAILLALVQAPGMSLIQRKQRMKRLQAPPPLKC